MPTRHLPQSRVRLALGALALLAATRALGYAIPRDVQDPLLAVTLNGALLPVYVTAWGTAAALCLWDMRRPTLRGWGPALTIGLMLAWGTAYLAGFIVAVAHGHWPFWWQAASLYLAAAAAITALMAPIGVIPRRRKGDA